MHRSRVGVVLIDHAEAHDEALGFWVGVVGGRSEASLGGSEFTDLGAVGSAQLAVQRVGAGTPARVHLDIETDDVGAEVRRVLALGARLVDDRGEHVILQDPGGVVFCVVPVQTGDLFAAEATTWD